MRKLALALGLSVAVGLSSCGGSDGESSAPISSTTSAMSPTSTTTSPPTATTRPVTSTTAAPSTSSPSTVELPAGPSFDLDFPDPFVMWTPDGFHALSTTSARVRIPHLDGPDLLVWAGPSDLLVDTPTWATPFSVWAPAVLDLGDRFVVYFTAEVEGTEMHCISWAASESVDGPFIDEHDEPPLCPRDSGGAIDPSPFTDSDGTRWLLWKNDGVTLRRDSAIWVTQLSDDGLDLVGEPVRLIGTDQNWEYPHVEAPSMLQSGNDYWLAYSGNWWNQAAYGVGLAKCSSPAGPCTKPFDHAVLTSEPGRFGPGGGEFFTDSPGRPLLAYHAWLDEPGYPGHRALFIARVTFGPDGSPMFG